MGVHRLWLEFLPGAISSGKLVNFDWQASSRDSSVGDYVFRGNTSGSVPTRIDQSLRQHLRGDKNCRIFRTRTEYSNAGDYLRHGYGSSETFVTHDSIAGRGRKKHGDDAVAYIH